MGQDDDDDCGTHDWETVEFVPVPVPGSRIGSVGIGQLQSCTVCGGQQYVGSVFEDPTRRLPPL